MARMTSRAMTIRLAEPRDVQAIALMSRDLIEAGLGWKYDSERIRGAMRQRETVVLVACERELVVGFAIMEFGEERAHLVLLAVRPAHRRRGIGRGLMEWLIESARTAGMASVHLELRAGNEAARGFYRALGFSETLLVPGYYRGREAALRMLRLLRAPGPAPFTWRPPALDQS
jgi:ribosomal-protein-alanine N-acetyltransferase